MGNGKSARRETKAVSTKSGRQIKTKSYETATANRQPPEKRGGRYEGTALWQKKFYDYILREGDSATGVAAYIWANPVRKGLCVDPRDYPHSGSFVLDWTKFVGSVEPWTPEWKRGNSGK